MKYFFYFILLSVTSFTQQAFAQNFSKIYNVETRSPLQGKSHIISTNDNGYVITIIKPGMIFGTDDSYPFIKTDSVGNIQFVKYFKYTGTAYQGASLPSQTIDSGFVIPGTFSNPSFKYSLPLLIKINKNGNIQWAKQYGNMKHIAKGVSSIATLNGYFVSGSIKDTVSQNNFVFILKTNFSGTLLWYKLYSISNKQEDINCFIKTYDGGLLLAGSDWQNAANGNTFLLKTDSLGNLSWANIYGLPHGSEPLSAIETIDHSIVITGRVPRNGGSDWDTHLMKFSETGIYKWGKRIGGIKPDEGYSVHQTTDNGFIICDEPEDSTSVSSTTSQTGLIKTDSTGVVQWAKIIRHTSKGTFPFGSVQNKDKSLTIAGMDGSYGDTARITLTRTDSLYSSVCQETTITLPSSSLSVTNTAVGSVITLNGELTFSVSDSTLQIPYSNLCSDVSIKEYKANDQILLYPNPASNQLYIETNTVDKLNVDLYDVNGRHMFSKNVSDKSNIDVTSLNEGIYTLTIKTADWLITKKLVIMR